MPAHPSFVTFASRSLWLVFVLMCTAFAAPDDDTRRAKKITLDAQNAEVQNVLRLIADVSGMNLVTSDAVNGKVTVKLKNVPWDQALRVVLATKGLDATVDGNIIRVAPREEIERERLERVARQGSCVDTAPLKVRVIPVNNARAQDLAPIIKTTLSARGTIAVDERTNSLIVKDVDCP